ncbi:MAG: AsmA family protein [Planctomycetota bacterium]
MGNSVNFEYFPYPLREVQGRIELRRDSIRLDNLTARPASEIQIGTSSGVIEMNGGIKLGQESWESMEFEIDARDIWLDDRLGSALPKDVGSFYQRFSPTGHFDLQDMKIALENNSDGGRTVEIEGDVTFKDCSIETFAPITGFNGQFSGIKSTYGTRRGFTHAEGVLEADSFRIKGALLKDFRAGVAYSEPEDRWYARNMVGDLYGGGLTGNFELKKSEEDRWGYVLDAGFDDVQLERFLEDAAIYRIERAYSKGQLGGSLCIEESFGQGAANSGRIRLLVTDMEVGRLSPISKILLVLNLNEPTDYAFERMLVDSYIRGDVIEFEKFDLSGKSVAFTGSGNLDLKSREVDLKLTARGKRLAGTEPGILESLTEGLGRGVVRMDVKGDIYDPDVTTTTLPVLEATLGILGMPDEDSQQ